MRVDLNRISIAGLVITALAVVLVVMTRILGESIKVGRLLGESAPFAEVELWMVLLVIGAVVYLVGRVVWVAQNRFP